MDKVYVVQRSGYESQEIIDNKFYLNKQAAEDRAKELKGLLPDDEGPMWDGGVLKLGYDMWSFTVEELHNNG
jgi:hypothetical protein